VAEEMLEHEEDWPDHVPAARLGRALRVRRVGEGMSQADAATAIGIKTGELRDIEAGVRSPKTAVVAQLLAVYGCGGDHLWAPRRPLDPALLGGQSEHKALRTYLELVRQWRGNDGRREMRFRRDDLAVLEKFLGTDASEIERRLMAISANERPVARRLRRLLHVSSGARPPGAGGAA
jgi:transcriptional regulator with XRE-family HTH domain